MPKKRNIGSDGKSEVTSRDLAERFVTFAAEQGVELRSGEIYGANLAPLERSDGTMTPGLVGPGEVLVSNRRAFFEPDPMVDSIVSKEMEDITRLKRALDAAGTDPQKRDELLWMIAGQNILHWMSVQPYADNQANAEKEAPAPRQRTGKGKRRAASAHKEQRTTVDRHWQPGDLLTVENAVRFTHRHEQTVRNWYRSGALQVLQPGGPGGAVLIPFENLLACLRHREASA